MALSELGLQLYVHASTRDNKSLGADILCHRAMMMFELKNIPLKNIYPVDSIKKTNVDLHFPFKIFPTLVIGESKDAKDIDDLDKIEKIFEKHGEPLPPSNQDIDSFVNVGPGVKVFHKFNYYIKNREQSGDETLRNQLATELKKVNGFLMSGKMPKDEEGNALFLGGKTPGLPDCILLPKLHYIYVSLGIVKEFPFESLPGIEAYLELGRNHPAFASTCPKKRDIVHYFCKQAGLDDNKAMRLSQIDD